MYVSRILPGNYVSKAKKFFLKDSDRSPLIFFFFIYLFYIIFFFHFFIFWFIIFFGGGEGNFVVAEMYPCTTTQCSVTRSPLKKYGG